MIILVLPWSLNLNVLTRAAQSEIKSLEKQEYYPNEPLNFLEIKAANKSIRLGEGFIAGDNWLENASFRVKNTSDKEIVYIEIDINFPETESSGNEMSYRLKFGHGPGAPDSNRALVFEPDAETILGLAGDQYTRLVKFVEERQQFSTISKATIRIGFVIFTDGTGWAGGQFHRPDANNPNRYIPIPN
jgi:hypothetical protein